MIPNAKNIQKYFSLKKLIIVAIALVISISAGVGAFHYISKDVVINDNGRMITLKTMKSNVAEVLKQHGIVVKPEDYISVSLDEMLEHNDLNKITIKRAIPVTILADGQEYRVKTWKDTVYDAILDSPVRLIMEDRLEGVDPANKVFEGMKIKVVRVRQTIETEQIPIPFEVLTRESRKMNKGQERVVIEGQEGMKEKRYQVRLEDGKVLSKTLVEDVVVQEPVNRVIEYGSILNFKNSRGDVVQYKKVLDMKATAYTASFKHTGKNPGHPQYGITYSGAKVKKGIVAVDPKVIPLGTRLYIEIAGKTADYGYAVAADIGSAVKKNRIDLYFEDEDIVDHWGMKNAKVYILMD